MVVCTIEYRSYSPYVCVDTVAAGVYEPALYGVSVAFVRVYAYSIVVRKLEYVTVVMTI